MEIKISKISSQLEKVQTVELDEKQLQRQRNIEEMARYENIIRSVAGKYGRDWCLTFDDVYSELCFKILTLGNDNGWENLNESMVAKICFNKAVDLYRKAKRKWKREISEMAIIGDVENGSSKIGTPEEAEQLVLISQFVEMYKPESRERKYLTIRLVSENLLPEEYAVKIGIEVPSGKIQDWKISEMLGLSPRSKSFERMKKALHEELVDYLGIEYKL